MIKQEAYTIDWLDAKVKEYEANSYDLAEKMTHAFTLLEHLKLKGLDFIFKGGTSMVLMIDEFHRFSKDIDIIVTKRPDNLHAIFDSIVADTPFIKWEQSERKNDEFQVPKEHYKFIYQESKPSKFPEKPVLLDIIFVENSYPETQVAKIKHALLSTEEPHTEITIPTFNSIAGDKLTAFAPKTIGIPMGKGKAVEIAKQLFDLNVLFDRVDSYRTVGVSFEKTAEMCIKHYQRNFTLEQIYHDIIETGYTMAMMGKHDADLYNEIKNGVTALSQYLNRKTNFGYNKALTAAARIAYMAACLMKGIEPVKLDWQTVSTDEFKNKKIDHEKYSVLNKALKAGYPEAWYYWLNTVQVLAMENKEPEKKVVPVAASAGLNDEVKKEEKPAEKKEDKNPNMSLTFIVNGKEVVIENVNPHEPLKATVQQALAKSGNSARPLTDWLVKWNDQDLDISKKVGDFNFPKDAKIFVSLKSGVGGSK